MPANNLQILQTQLLTLRRQEAGILSIQSTLGGQVSAVEQELDAAVLVAEAATAALRAIQTTVATVSNTQTSLDATLGTVQADINRVDSQVTSASSSSGHTRSAVQSLVQQLVHPDATWEEGSSSYTLPVDAVPIYQAIQNETTSLDARVTASEGNLVPADAQIYASTHASDPAYLPRDVADAVVTVDGAAVKFWGSEAGGGQTLQFVSSDAKGTPTYDLAGRAVTLSASYMPVSNPVNSITLVDQTLILAVRMQAGSAAYANDRTLIGYGQWSSSDTAFVGTVNTGRWKIQFVKHSTYTEGGKQIIISPANASTIMSQVHDFVLAFAFRSATQDFLVRWVYLATDGSTLEEGPAYVVSGDYGINSTYITNPDPGVHTFGLGHQSQYTITGAGVKDVRVYPVPLDETALNAEFDATVALITARVTAAGTSSSPPSVSTGSLRLHIDASDDNSLWTDNSMTSKVTTGEVRFVKDLSGSGHHLQYNSGNLITTGTSTNGDTTLRTISHDSGGQAGYNWQGVLLSDTAATGGVLFMVIKQTDGSGSGGFMVPDWATLPDTANTNPSAVYPGFWMGDGASAYMWPAGGQHQLVIFRGDPTANVSRLYAMAAGAYDNSPLVTSPYSTELLARPMMCHHYRGETCEVLYYTGVMSDEDFNSTALYLLNKWLGPSTA